MKLILYITAICVSSVNLYQDGLCQTGWGYSQICHTNARTNDTPFNGRFDVIDATFMWRITRHNGTRVRYTGALMNRRIEQ